MTDRVLLTLLIGLLAVVLGWLIGTIVIGCWWLHGDCAWGWQQDTHWVWFS